MIAPLGLSTVAMPICAPDVLELKVLLDQLRGVDLNPDCRRLLAADPHQRHTGNLADTLGEDVFGGVVDVDDRGDVGLDRQDQNGRVGRG